MKLWLVDSRGWEMRFTVVRAETRDDAIRVAHEKLSECDVTELPCEGDEKILWSWEYSPDSRDYD